MIDMPREIINWQKAINLRTKFNLNATEIAARLGCSASAIRAYFHRHKIPKAIFTTETIKTHRCAMPHCKKQTSNKYCYRCFHATNQAAKRVQKEFCEALPSDTYPNRIDAEIEELDIVPNSLKIFEE